MRDRHLILICGVMLSLNAISCDILMPSFFALESAFSATRTEIQAVMPLYLMAAASGQIVFGPMSDRFGRKPILRIGVALYLAGTLAAIMAPSLVMLYAARALQGFGASCMIVLARAMLRDNFTGDALGRAMALSMAIFVIGPMLAPLAGVLALAAGGWQGPFVALAAVAAALAVSQLWITETNARPDPAALQPRRLFGAIARLFRHHQSRHFLLAMIACQTVVVIFVTNMPQMFRSQFGIDGLPFALLFACGAAGIVVGQIANARLIARYGLLAVSRLAAVLVMSVALGTAIFATRLGVIGFVGLLFAFNATFLVLLAHGTTMVIEPHHDIAGTASAVLGMVTQFIGASIALALLPEFNGTVADWAPWHSLVMGLVALWIYSFRPRSTVDTPPHASPAAARE
jgi:DHA1 family bicyclomycin/chloramphenicol resistance-like MFS transporter